MSKVYSINNLSYKVAEKQIIKNISCELEEGITIIKGPNGAGKTTLLKLLFGLINPTQGCINKNFNESITRTSFVFQNPVFLNRTVEDNLKHTLCCKNIPKENWDKIIAENVNLYSIENIIKLNISMLSGGELQLLSLIRSIMIQPHILFYDEQTNNLDERNINLLMAIIKKLYSQGRTIIMVSHNDFSHYKIKHNKVEINQGVLKC